MIIFLSMIGHIKAQVWHIKIVIAIILLSLELWSHSRALGAKLKHPLQDLASGTPGQRSSPSFLQPFPPIFMSPPKTSSVAEFRTPEHMSLADIKLAEQSEEAISEEARHHGFDLQPKIKTGTQTWLYEQAVCPVFPNFLILEYSQIRGLGDISLFSAIIPRETRNHVRIIPIQRRSNSLWTPATANRLSINDFNQMMGAQSDRSTPDWPTLGLCYEILTKGRPSMSLSSKETYSPPVSVQSIVFEKKTVTLYLNHVSACKSPGALQSALILIFSRTGKLLKVKSSRTNVCFEQHGGLSNK